MIRIIAKLFAVAVGFTICLPVLPSSAENVAFVSATGTSGPCAQTAPCASIFQAIVSLPNTGGRIVCATPVSETGGFNFSGGTWVFDCPSAVMHGNLTISGNAVLKFQHMSFSLGANKIFVSAGGGGTLIYDDCVLEDATGTPLDVEPAFPLNLVIKNSRVSNNTAAGVLIKPASGGSVVASFDGVTITKNAGGLRTDSTNGAVRVDISNSTISNNADNGLIALGGAGGINIVTLKSDVVASNGQAGIEASGANALILVNNAVLDQNVAGAISVVSGGHINTYGNNSIIGNPGSAWTGTAPLQ